MVICADVQVVPRVLRFVSRCFMNFSVAYVPPVCMKLFHFWWKLWSSFGRACGRLLIWWMIESTVLCSGMGFSDMIMSSMSSVCDSDVSALGFGFHSFVAMGGAKVDQFPGGVVY